MLPILFSVGGLTLRTFGLLLALAFLISIVYARRELTRKGMEADLAYDLAIAALLGGVGGARLVYVFSHLKEYLANPLSIFAVWEGGLIFYGGLAGGTLAVLYLVYRRKLAVAKIADVLAPCLAIGSAIGRLGCFANGCCFGERTTLPWGVTFTNPQSVAPLGVPLNPTQLIESSYNLAIFAILLFARKKVDRDGFVFWLFLGLYGLFRFLVEFLRVRPIVIFGLGGSQLFSLGLVVASVVVIAVKYAAGRGHGIGSQVRA